MHKNFYLIPFSTVMTLAIASLVHAAEPIELSHSSFSNVRQHFIISIPGLKKTKAISVNTLDMIKQHVDKNNVNHLRMQQHYLGFPVFGGYAVMHSSKQKFASLSTAKSDITMNGTVYTGLQNELGQVDQNFIKNGYKALAQFKEQYAGKSIREEKIIPIIYIDEKHQSHWAYQISLLVVYKNQMPERPTAIIEAVTNKTFVRWNAMKTLRVPVSGLGFGGNDNMGVHQYGKDLPLLKLSRDTDDGKCYMDTADVKVVDMQHSESPSSEPPMSFNCPIDQSKPVNAFWTGYRGDGYDRINGAYSPSNDALYIAPIIKQLYRDWYNMEVLTNADGTPTQFVMLVHWGTGFENASFSDGGRLMFGDGNTNFYPLMSLGSVAHEVGHLFIQQHSNLVGYGQSAGIEESFCDISAQAAEYYYFGKNSWMIGSEIVKKDSSLGGALRYMDMPSRDGQSIDSADQYHASMNEHYSSGVYNHLFYIMSHQNGWDTRKAFDVMLKANIDYWTPQTNFSEGGCGVISATQDFGYSVEDVKKSLKAVGINYDSCITMATK